MVFSAVYRPTALFSLRDSNSTSSGAKSLFLPSPYVVKMALVNQAISLGGVDFDKEPQKFWAIRDLKISYRISGNFCVNNCFVKIQKQRDKEPFKSTVSFREYVFLDSDLELIFETKGMFGESVFLKQYLCTINQFGKRGCFFQFVGFRWQMLFSLMFQKFNQPDCCKNLTILAVRLILKMLTVIQMQKPREKTEFCFCQLAKLVRQNRIHIIKL